MPDGIPETIVTQYLVDIAFYQAGLNIAEVKREGFAAVLARASTGYQGGTKDSEFATFKSQARRAGILFGAYHFLYPASVVSVEHQANVCASAIGDTDTIVMIDHEPDGSNAPTPAISTAVHFANAMRDKGYTVPLWYLPHWVWQRLGSPALPKNADLKLVSSSYVSGSGYASDLYPGDHGVGWDSYGGLTPVIWQFTDQAKVAGQLIDADGYRGSYADLKALFSPKGDDVPIYTSVSATNVKLTAGQNHNVAFTHAGVEGQWTPPNGKATAVGPGVFTGDITINVTLPAGAELHYRFVEADPDKNYAIVETHGPAEMRHGGGVDYGHDTTVSWVGNGLHLWVQLWCSHDVTIERVGAKVALFR